MLLTSSSERCNINKNCLPVSPLPSFLAWLWMCCALVVAASSTHPPTLCCAVCCAVLCCGQVALQQSEAVRLAQVSELQDRLAKANQVMMVSGGYRRAMRN
jgi:hypothetical protein